jgi:hypothetical protein
VLTTDQKGAVAETAIIHQLSLRLAPAANNQRLKVNWAADYEFGAKLARPQGAVAQLGERQSGTLEVTGSSPVGSIN